MKLLLDTQVWLWMVVEPGRLKGAVRDLLAAPEHVLYLSAASTWEMAIKFRLGRLPLPEAPETFVPPRMVRDGIQPLSIEQVHTFRVASLPPHHRDPFDRLLVAQAQIEGLALVSADDQLRAYAVEFISAS